MSFQSYGATYAKFCTFTSVKTLKCPPDSPIPFIFHSLSCRRKCRWRFIRRLYKAPEALLSYHIPICLTMKSFVVTFAREVRQKLPSLYRAMVHEWAPALQSKKLLHPAFTGYPLNTGVLTFSLTLLTLMSFYKHIPPLRFSGLVDEIKTHSNTARASACTFIFRIAIDRSRFADQLFAFQATHTNKMSKPQQSSVSSLSNLMLQRRSSSIFCTRRQCEVAAALSSRRRLDILSV